eukprot:6209185-Pleurochrysis_carterae.AAC.2
MVRLISPRSILCCLHACRAVDVCVPMALSSPPVRVSLRRAMRFRQAERRSLLVVFRLEDGPEDVSQRDDAREVRAVDHWQVAHVVREEDVEALGDGVGERDVHHVLERRHDG